MRRKILVRLIILSSLLSICISIYAIHLQSQKNIWWHQDRQWRSIPVLVECHGYTIEEEESCPELTLAAISSINKQLGFEMLRFRYRSFGYSGGIKIMMGVPREGGTHRGGSAELHWLPSYRYFSECEIRTMREVHEYFIPIVLMHEIGHCLNLRHDNSDRTSIMYPSATDMIILGDLPRLTDEDQEALRELYN